MQYDVADGKAVMRADENGSLYRIDKRYNNPYISLACEDDFDVIAAMDYYAAYENAEYLDGCGFLFDGTNIQDKYTEIVNKIYEFAPLYADEDGDVEQYIADFNASLYAANLQDVLDEVDRQLEVYDEANN